MAMTEQREKQLLWLALSLAAAGATLLWLNSLWWQQQLLLLIGAALLNLGVFSAQHRYYPQLQQTEWFMQRQRFVWWFALLGISPLLLGGLQALIRILMQSLGLWS